MSSNNSTFPRYSPIQDDDEYVMSEEVRTFLFILAVAISLLGITSNIINISVFYKLPGGDPININLLGLAVSDLAVSLTTFLLVVSTAHWILEYLFTTHKINPIEVFYIIFGVPHTIFVRISVLLTTLISVERCLCVVLPLKVKMIINNGRVKMSVGVSFLIGVLVSGPIYYVNRLDWVYEPFLNMSILRHVKTDEFYDMNYWFTPVEGICLHIIPFIAVAASTILMIRSLKKRLAFRQSVTRTQSTEIVHREKKIAMMVAIMSTVFLVCNLPNIGMFLVTVFYPSEFSLRTGSASDSAMLMGFVPILLDTFNSAINIFIYYTNSSNYRIMCNTIFRLKRE